jgi:hypothetical protein
MNKPSSSVSRLSANPHLEAMREETDAAFKMLLSSSEKISIEKAIDAISAFNRNNLRPYLTAESEYINILLNQERARRIDYLQFFESDCLAALDSLFEAHRRFHEVEVLAYEIRARAISESRSGKATGRRAARRQAARERLLADLSGDLAWTSSLGPDQKAVVSKIRKVTSSGRVKLEQAVAQGLGPLEEATALCWVAFSIFVEEETKQGYYLQRIRAALSETFFAYKDCRETQGPLRLAAKQLQRYLRTNANSVKALELMVSIQRSLGRDDALYKAETDLRRARVAIASSHASQPQPPVHLDPSGISFEIKCKRLLEAMGFDANVTEVTADGGIDIVATRSDPVASGRYIVQCKDWQNKVGVTVIRELYGVVIAEDANKGVLITSSEFTSSAVAFAEGKRLELIDGQALQSLVSKYMKKRE